MKPIYESILILNAKLEKTVIENEIKTLTATLQSYSTEKKVKVDVMGERQLAYEIKTHKTGYYVQFYFESDPINIDEWERILRINEHVIKFITVRVADDTGDMSIYEEYTSTLEDLNPAPDEKTEQSGYPDALDVLLGFADYNYNYNRKEK